MPDRPTGTVTFLFTDIEGSTALWEQHPEEARLALLRHDALVERSVAEYDGLWCVPAARAIAASPSLLVPPMRYPPPLPLSTFG